MERLNRQSNPKVGKVFLVFSGLCIIALPLVVISAFSSEPKQVETALVEPQSLDFDYNGRAVFTDYDRMSTEYLKGVSTGRTLSDYYSRRQYPGSPPVIPHPVEVHKKELDCLACHSSGGWTEALKSITPVTPHPEQVSCMQCHVWLTTDSLFKATDWQSIPPPRLGRSELPGSPPPIPHDLQMRGNCIACHVGPGTVTAIRVEHPSRGNCRQCHVPRGDADPFQRHPKY